MEPARPIRILILAHDLSDSAIERRIIMLLAGGAKVSLAGFRRTATPINKVAGIDAIDFGQTFNGGFAQRIFSILKKVITLNDHKDLFQKADIIIARNLEMLALAVRGRAIAQEKPTLVYECLDIHRLLLDRGVVGTILRALEGWLGRRVTGVITSSPAYMTNYLGQHRLKHLPVRLVENKVLDIGDTLQPAPLNRPVAPPWVIGWFGIIRCRQSLAILRQLVQQSAGKVHVIIRGKPALDQFDDFAGQTSGLPGLTFLGPYKNPDDLAAMYSAVHFTWAIDRFEQGQNSAWLLPNRLYEGGKFASVPIAEEQVETGRTLNKLGIGVTLQEPLSEKLALFFETLTPQGYESLSSAVKSIPAATWSDDIASCTKLVDDLCVWHNQANPAASVDPVRMRSAI